MINFVEGKKYFYISPDERRYGHRIHEGTFVSNTSKYCIIEANIPGKGKQQLRKAQKLVFETEKEAKIAVIKDVIDRYGIGIIDIGNDYHEFIEEFPEKFV